MKSILLMLLLISVHANAFQDPTKGKPFFPWVWHDQLEPTFEHSLGVGGLSILGAGAVGTIATHQYDSDVQQANARGDHLVINQDAAGVLGTVGGGAVGIGIAVVQLFVDQPNGLKHTRAITLTALSHVTLAFTVRRPRPPGRGDYLPFSSSWPSGHASSAFATAESLAYSYGWWVGVPANVVAIAISTARVSENAHWLSDVVAGAALGIFWAHASNAADELEPAKQTWQLMPVPLEDGLALNLTKRF
jgi:hypothetical protein